jgi:hypothetical protein
MEIRRFTPSLSAFHPGSRQAAVAEKPAVIKSASQPLLATDTVSFGKEDGVTANIKQTQPAGATEKETAQIIGNWESRATRRAAETALASASADVLKQVLHQVIAAPGDGQLSDLLDKATTILVRKHGLKQLNQRVKLDSDKAPAGQYLLYRAMAPLGGKPQYIMQLLELGALKMNDADEHPGTMATMYRNPEVLRYMLKEIPPLRRRVMAQDTKGSTLLMHALLGRHLENARLILKTAVEVSSSPAAVASYIAHKAQDGTTAQSTLVELAPDNEFRKAAEALLYEYGATAEPSNNRPGAATPPVSSNPEPKTQHSKLRQWFGIG